MRKHIRSIVIITIFAVLGVFIGMYFNDLNGRLQNAQPIDYLHMPTDSYLYVGIPIFLLMIGLVVLGYLFDRKFLKGEF